MIVGNRIRFGIEFEVIATEHPNEERANSFYGRIC